MKNSSLSKVNEYKVPYDNCGYAALVDELGNLLITGGEGTPMMKIHQKTKGLKKLKAKIPLNFFDLKALRVVVGPYYWILGGGYLGCSNTDIFNFENIYDASNSKLFEYTSKQKWISGPTLPKNVAFLYSSAIAINATAVIFVRASPAKPHHSAFFNNSIVLDNNAKNAHKLNFIYNFEDSSWRRIADLPDQFSIGSKYELPLTITIDKNGTKLLQMFGFDQDDGFFFSIEKEVTIWTLNLESRIWSKGEITSKVFVTSGIDIYIDIYKETYFKTSILGTLFTIRGILYYFASPNVKKIFGYKSSNGKQWNTLSNKGKLSCNFGLIEVNYFSLLD